MDRRKAALIFDVDYTLIDGYHPTLILEKRGVDVSRFWRKVVDTELIEQGKGEKTSLDIIYLIHFMNEVRRGRLIGLSISEIKETGKNLDKMFYPGLPDFFDNIRQSNPNCQISHNLVTVGIKPLLEGSILGRYMDNIFGYTFFDGLTDNEQIDEIKSTSSSQEKTYAIDTISHGRNTEGFEYPIKQMIYIGDGKTDKKAFKFVKRWGGWAICVYDPFKPDSLEKAKQFERDVDAIFPADYRIGSPLWKFIDAKIKSFG